MLRRLRSWARTLTKLVLLVLGYIWIGGAYKLAYAQLHDLNRFRSNLPISYYQQQFILDALLQQTWVFGPDFKDYIGVLPNLGTLASVIAGGNPQAVLADYLREREQQLSTLPDRYPHSLFADEALQDAYLFSQGAALMGMIGAREQPRTLVATRTEGGRWRTTGMPDLNRASLLSRRLADQFPDSPAAPQALLRVAQSTQNPRERQELYRRLAAEYPGASEAEQASNALYDAARSEGKMDEAREYRRRALRAAEQSARERFPGKALPARTTLTLLGFRVDLSLLELQLQRPPIARTFLAEAQRDVERLRSIPAMEEPDRDRLSDQRSRLERARSELWVSDLFQTLKVGVPGPPPRPREYTVSGRALLGEKPLPGVEVLLAEREFRGGGMEALGQLGQVRHRAVTDRRGAFRVPGVPAGEYRVVAVYPAQPEVAGGAPVVPVAAADTKDAIPEKLVLTDRALSLPPLRFEAALRSRTFGEVDAVGAAVPLEWETYPGAAAYRVEVVPAHQTGAYQGRVPPDRRQEFFRNPVLWEAKSSEPRAECPLLPLAPDVPQMAQMAQYEYRVTALDAGGRELARSVPALGRFNLSTKARAKLMELKPPVRQGGQRRRGPRFGPRQGEQQ